jgi:D-beta-D-heptose 7-phosphate kinase/D-beta-D-heptose 1-phosphate adenosyltransferase
MPVDKAADILVAPLHLQGLRYIALAMKDRPPTSQPRLAASEDTRRVIARFGAVTVLVVGDFILDRFINGVIERISPEAPIPVLHGKTATIALGGAGNVVANIASLGGRAVPLAVLGNDHAGREIIGKLAELGVDTGGLALETGRMTPSKSRYIALNQQVLRFDEEEVRALDATARDALVSRFRTALGAADIVVLSDYGKGVLMGGVAKELIAAGRAAGKPVLVDPKGSDWSSYAGATAVTPNRRELGEAAGRPVFDDGEIGVAARQLIEACGLEFMLVTRSEKGMSVVTPTEAQHITTRAREVFDVSGAGDTVIAAFALSLAAGAGRAAAATIANAAAGVVVGKRGTARLTSDELAGAMFAAHGEVPSARAVLDGAAVKRLVDAWKREGLTVGFTNGCFDILHAGHISLLNAARSQCDRLVLGLNSDASVRRLKGEGRPVNDEHDRACVLAALASVDAVVLFCEDTPLALIEALKPDILVKGADYAVDQVVGANVVRQAGGRVVLVDIVAGRSTTGTIARLRARAGGGE